jgi:hypothetical protein
MRKPKPDAEERARDAAQAMAEYQAEVIATREKTARLKKLRLAKKAADAVPLAKPRRRPGK